MANLFISFSKLGTREETNLELKSIARAAVLATLMREGVRFNTELSITFTANEYIHKLNREHRGVDRHTDVLSFPMYEGEEIAELGEGDTVNLGDIVISLERAREQAEELGNEFKREVAFLVIHSVLHLLGYDHERSKEDDELQCRLQREIIETLDI